MRSIVDRLSREAPRGKWRRLAIALAVLLLLSAALIVERNSSASALIPADPGTPDVCAFISGITHLYPAEGNTADVVGNANGNISGTLTYRSGESGQAFDLDGTTKVFTSIGSASARTIEAWINPGSLDGGWPDPGLNILRRTAAGGVANCGDWAIGLYGGKLGGLYRPVGGACTAALQSNIAVQTGTWYHVAMTYDGTTAALYVNGQLQETAATEPGYAFEPNFSIGGTECCSGDNIVGGVDDVGVYDRALTQNEIQSIFAAGPAGKCASPTPTPTPTSTPFPTPTPTPTPSPTPANPDLSGSVKTEAGVPIEGVLVALSGSESRNALTDANGRYQFSSVQFGGSYTITPSKFNFDFQPANVSLGTVVSNTVRDFQGRALSRSIEGRVTDTAGIGIGNVSVRISGPASVLLKTDSSGRFLGAGLTQGSYTVEPSSDAFTFSPATTLLIITDHDESAVFTGSPVQNAPGKIVFFSDDGIYSTNADGTAVTRLLNTQNGDGIDPQWSRDGKRIVYPLVRSGQIMDMNADGTGVRDLFATGGDAGEPTYSPDSTQILFHGAGKIFRIGKDGGLVDSFVQPRFFNHQQWLSNNTIGWWQRLTATPLIRLMDLGGTNIGILGLGGLPSWSPDEQKIAFTRQNAPPGEYGECFSDIYIMNSDGSGTHRIAHGTYPTWSPDGDQIAYERCTYIVNGSNVSLNRSLYVMNADGSNQHLIVPFGDTPNWGRHPLFPTPAGQSVEVNAGTVQLEFSGINSAGSTTVTSISPSALHPIPDGYAAIQGAGLAYDIKTTANYLGPITECFKVEAINDPAIFNSLRVLHTQNGVLVDRTVLAPDPMGPNFNLRRICSRTESLSPFTLVEAVDTSLPDLSGVVRDQSGRPLPDVDVDISGAAVSSTRTDINGVYSFPNLTTGGTYVVKPRSKGKYAFDPVISTHSDLRHSEADVFSAASCNFQVNIDDPVVPAGGAPRTVHVVTQTGCQWYVGPSDPWIHAAGDANGGTGSGDVMLSFDENVEGIARYGILEIAGNVVIVQEGSATISGRVVGPDGRGVRNARVTLIDSAGAQRSVMTSSLGFYSIADVAAGGQYTLTVSSKQYRFGRKEINVHGDLPNVDFAGQE